MSTAQGSTENTIDSLARQFVSSEYLDPEDAAQKSREAVMKEGGSRNFTHFLANLCSQPHIPNVLHTLIIIAEEFDKPFAPLYGVERWGRDGLLLEWQELLKEEVEEEGSLERCMHAIGSLCRTSLRELQLFGLRISPKHLSSLSHAMHEPPPSIVLGNAPAGRQVADGLSSAHVPGYSLQCLRLWGLQHEAPGAESGASQDLQAVLFTLPPSLRFLLFNDDASFYRLFDEDLSFYQPTIKLLAPRPVVDQQATIMSDGSHTASPLDRAVLAPSEAGVGVRSWEAGEAAAHEEMSSGSRCDYPGAFKLSSLLCCPHLHLQGLAIWSGSIHRAGGLIHGDDDLRNAASSLAQNTCLRALGIYVDDSALLPAEWATEGLKRNTSLTTLHLMNFRMPSPGGFDLFFKEGVAHNHSLTQLSLRRCEGPWTVEAILDSLQDNGALHDIDLRSTPLQEEEAAIGAQLERNKRSAEMMRRVALNQRKVQPRAARVFLCGEPFAGKTTIVKSLSMLFKPTWKKLCDKDWLLYHKFRRERPRTKGIEVTSLERRGEKFLFWDLAGQNEYHFFHDYVFPDLSSRQSPSFFLFVWSPICRNTQQRKRGERLIEELEYWLKFIASKTRKSKSFIPKLIIAITRKDKVPDAKVAFQGEINSCKKNFEDLVNIELNNVFEIDSRDPLSVDPLGQCILEMGSNILKSVKPVLELKEKIRTFFDKKVRNKEVSPIITKDDYIKLCEQLLGEGCQDMVESIALLLNESGDFIYGGSHKFVILDTRWFCHTIMGNLIHSTGPRSHIICKDGPGFFEKDYLQLFLEKEVLSLTGDMKDVFHFSFKRKKKITINSETLLELLIDMNVAYIDHGTSTIFLPSSLGYQEGPTSSQEKVRSYEDTTSFTLGRQLKCEDSKHTFLTPSVFPSLQVLFLKKFRKERVELGKDFIDVNHESGIHAIVEFCASEGVEHSIDILVISKRDLSYCVSLIQEDLVSEIVKLCASSKGIQGVKLVQSVIGPTTNIFLGQKRRQVVSMKELQDVVRKDLVRNCQIDQIVYAWPNVAITASSTRPPSPIKDHIIKLLSIFEIQEVSEEFRRTLKEVVTIIITDPILKMETDETGKLLSMSQSIDGEFGKILGAILAEIKAMREEVHQGMQHIYDKLVEINNGLCNLRSEVCERLQGMQELIRQSEERRLPTMWVLVIDRGKIVAKLAQIGFHGAKLNLLCEYKRKPHLPEDQIGLSFSYLDDESVLKRAIPYLKIFLKIAYVAAKVGAHLVSGVGDELFPDFSEVASIFEDWHSLAPTFLELESSSDLPKDVASSSDQISRRVYQERARKWLWEFLEKEKCDTNATIYAKFKLNRVRYKANNQIGWLCDNHANEGVTNDHLEMI